MNSLEHYTKLLDDLKNLELKLNDSEEPSDEEEENELIKLKREICVDKLKSKQIFDDLDSSDCSLELAEKLCKLIAELAKDETCRNFLVEQNLFKPLNKFLTSSSSTHLVQTQVCRAIGNLCYYNDTGRLKFYERCGLGGLLNLCKYCTSLDLETDQKEKCTLLMVVLGCLHNVTNENETLRKAAYDLDVMVVLKDFTPYLKYEKGILIHFGSLVENLIELDQGKELFVQEKVALSIYSNLSEEILKNLDDYTEDFFLVLSSINDLEKGKEYLCQTNFLELVIEYVEKNLQDEELMRYFGLFLTNLLVKDENVEIMFEYKNNLILTKAINWLNQTKSEQLYVTSAVVIANFMRSDEKALQMIKHEQKPHVKIINLLKNYSNLGSVATLQQINVSHSLLATLRNFCIAASSREEILKSDIVEVALDFLNFENLEVKWKALGIIRLLVKNCTDKTGLNQIFEDTVLEKISQIANSPQEHAGVTGESSRLVCYLPIAAKSEKNIAKFSKFKFIDVICTQLKSEHLIMLNEALLALNVLLTVDYRGCFEQLKASKLNENLKELFNRESLPIEMRSNALKIFKYLFDRNDFFTEQDLADHLNLLKKLKQNNDNEFLKSHLNQLINLVENAI